MKLDPIKEALARSIEREKLHQKLFEVLGPTIVNILQPTLDRILGAITKQSAEMRDAIGQNIDKSVNRQAQEIRDAIAQVKVEVKPEFKVPETKLPEIKIPAFPKIPKPEVTVTIPPIKVPKAEVEVKIPPIKVPKPEVTVNVPEITMPDEMTVRALEPLAVTVENQISIPKPLKAVDKVRSSLGQTGSVSIATSATQVSTAKNRKSIVLVHEASADTVYVSKHSDVTTWTGFPIVANQIYGYDDYNGPVYAIISSGAASSTIALRFDETD